MSAFEDFVQLELPKRPFLESDTAQETVMVRRGPGPRQLAGVTIAEGQVLTMLGGTLVGADITSIPGGGVRSFVLPVASPLSVWTVTHNLGSDNVIVQVVDDSGYVIIPDQIQIVDTNNVTISFGTAQTGTVRIIFLD
jgi:hypothetical protein